MVIAGYFTSQSIEKQILYGGTIVSFIINRLFRLWPLVLIAGFICLGYGLFMMLPDDLENTAQSVIATNFFANNILQAITTKNYWDVVNEYKPLMHTWYVGIIMQFYVVISVFLFVVGRYVKNAHKRNITNIVVISTLFLISLFMYFVGENSAAKFYYLPYRLYEFCAGSLVFYFFGKKQVSRGKNIWSNIAFSMVYIAIMALLFINREYMTQTVKLLSIVVLTSLLIIMMPRVKVAQGNVFSNKWVAAIGAASFSIFVWHQVVLAFIRYSFTNDLTNILPLFSFIGITAVMSVLTYKYVEQMKKTKVAWIAIGLLLILTTSVSLYIYKNAGVIRDVPELEVVKGKGHKGMWAEYCDRVMIYDRDFPETDKPKWYVFGNSFGRDFVNIILESDIANDVAITYSATLENRENRLKEANVVFISTNGVNEALIEKVRSMLDKHTKLYIIGEKNFGENNGQIYRHRFENDYHFMTIEMEDGYAEKNEKLKEVYPDIYIDIIAMVRHEDGKMPVFSDDGRFISQDCRHLTKAGAQYYSKLMDWDRFLERK